MQIAMDDHQLSELPFQANPDCESQSRVALFTEARKLRKDVTFLRNEIVDGDREVEKILKELNSNKRDDNFDWQVLKNRRLEYLQAHLEDKRSALKKTSTDLQRKTTKIVTDYPYLDSQIEALDGGPTDALVIDLERAVQAWIIGKLEVDGSIRSILFGQFTRARQPPESKWVFVGYEQEFENDVERSLRKCSLHVQMMSSTVVEQVSKDGVEDKSFIMVLGCPVSGVNGRFLKNGSRTEYPRYRNVNGWELFHAVFSELPTLNIFASNCYDMADGPSLTETIKRDAARSFQELAKRNAREEYGQAGFKNRFHKVARASSVLAFKKYEKEIPTVRIVPRAQTASIVSSNAVSLDLSDMAPSRMENDVSNGNRYIDNEHSYQSEALTLVPQPHSPTFEKKESRMALQVLRHIEEREMMICALRERAQALERAYIEIEDAPRATRGVETKNLVAEFYKFIADVDSFRLTSALVIESISEWTNACTKEKRRLIKHEFTGEKGSDSPVRTYCVALACKGQELYELSPAVTSQSKTFKRGPEDPKNAIDIRIVGVYSSFEEANDVLSVEMANIPREKKLAGGKAGEIGLLSLRPCRKHYLVHNKHVDAKMKCEQCEARKAAAAVESEMPDEFPKFMWRGQEYLKKMLDDLSFLSSNILIQRLPTSTGIDHNPLLLQNSVYRNAHKYFVENKNHITLTLMNKQKLAPTLSTKISTDTLESAAKPSATLRLLNFDRNKASLKDAGMDFGRVQSLSDDRIFKAISLLHILTLAPLRDLEDDSGLDRENTSTSTMMGSSLPSSKPSTADSTGPSTRAGTSHSHSQRFGNSFATTGTHPTHASDVRSSNIDSTLSSTQTESKFRRGVYSSYRMEGAEFTVMQRRKPPAHRSPFVFCESRVGEWKGLYQGIHVRSHEFQVKLIEDGKKRIAERQALQQQMRSIIGEGITKCDVQKLQSLIDEAHTMKSSMLDLDVLQAESMIAKTKTFISGMVALQATQRANMAKKLLSEMRAEEARKVAAFELLMEVSASTARTFVSDILKKSSKSTLAKMHCRQLKRVLTLNGTPYLFTVGQGVRHYRKGIEPCPYCNSATRVNIGDYTQNNCYCTCKMVCDPEGWVVRAYEPLGRNVWAASMSLKIVRAIVLGSRNLGTVVSRPIKFDVAMQDETQAQEYLCHTHKHVQHHLIKGCTVSLPHPYLTLDPIQVVTDTIEDLVEWEPLTNQLRAKHRLIYGAKRMPEVKQNFEEARAHYAEMEKELQKLMTEEERQRMQAEDMLSRCFRTHAFVTKMEHEVESLMEASRSRMRIIEQQERHELLDGDPEWADLVDGNAWRGMNQVRKAKKRLEQNFEDHRVSRESHRRICDKLNILNETVKIAHERMRSHGSVLEEFQADQYRVSALSASCMADAQHVFGHLASTMRVTRKCRERPAERLQHISYAEVFEKDPVMRVLPIHRCAWRGLHRATRSLSCFDKRLGHRIIRCSVQVFFDPKTRNFMLRVDSADGIAMHENDSSLQMKLSEAAYSSMAPYTLRNEVVVTPEEIKLIVQKPCYWPLSIDSTSCFEPARRRTDYIDDEAAAPYVKARKVIPNPITSVRTFDYSIQRRRQTMRFRRKAVSDYEEHVARVIAGLICLHDFSLKPCIRLLQMYRRIAHFDVLLQQSRRHYDEACNLMTPWCNQVHRRMHEVCGNIVKCSIQSAKNSFEVAMKVNRCVCYLSVPFAWVFESIRGVQKASLLKALEYEIKLNRFSDDSMQFLIDHIASVLPGKLHGARLPYPQELPAIRHCGSDVNKYNAFGYRTSRFIGSKCFDAKISMSNNGAISIELFSSSQVDAPSTHLYRGDTLYIHLSCEEVRAFVMKVFMQSDAVSDRYATFSDLFQNHDREALYSLLLDSLIIINAGNGTPTGSISPELMVRSLEQLRKSTTIVVYEGAWKSDKATGTRSGHQACDFNAIKESNLHLQIKCDSDRRDFYFEVGEMTEVAVNKILGAQEKIGMEAEDKLSRDVESSFRQQEEKRRLLFRAGELKADLKSVQSSEKFHRSQTSRIQRLRRDIVNSLVHNVQHWLAVSATPEHVNYIRKHCESAGTVRGYPLDIENVFRRIFGNCALDESQVSVESLLMSLRSFLEHVDFGKLLLDCGFEGRKSPNKIGSASDVVYSGGEDTYLEFRCQRRWRHDHAHNQKSRSEFKVINRDGRLLIAAHEGIPGEACYDPDDCSTEKAENNNPERKSNDHASDESLVTTTMEISIVESSIIASKLLELSTSYQSFLAVVAQREGTLKEMHETSRSEMVWKEQQLNDVQEALGKVKENRGLKRSTHPSEGPELEVIEFRDADDDATTYVFSSPLTSTLTSTERCRYDNSFPTIYALYAPADGNEACEAFTCDAKDFVHHCQRYLTAVDLPSSSSTKRRLGRSSIVLCAGLTAPAEESLAGNRVVEAWMQLEKSFPKAPNCAAVEGEFACPIKGSAIILLRHGERHWDALRSLATRIHQNTVSQTKAFHEAQSLRYQSAKRCHRAFTTAMRKAADLVTSSIESVLTGACSLPNNVVRRGQQSISRKDALTIMKKFYQIQDQYRCIDIDDEDAIISTSVLSHAFLTDSRNVLAPDFLTEEYLHESHCPATICQECVSPERCASTRVSQLVYTVFCEHVYKCALPTSCCNFPFCARIRETLGESIVHKIDYEDSSEGKRSGLHPVERMIKILLLTHDRTDIFKYRPNVLKAVTEAVIYEEVMGFDLEEPSPQKEPKRTSWRKAEELARIRRFEDRRTASRSIAGAVGGDDLVMQRGGAFVDEDESRLDLSTRPPTPGVPLATDGIVGEESVDPSDGQSHALAIRFSIAVEFIRKMIVQRRHAHLIIRLQPESDPGESLVSEDVDPFSNEPGAHAAGAAAGWPLSEKLRTWFFERLQPMRKAYTLRDDTILKSSAFLFDRRHYSGTMYLSDGTLAFVDILHGDFDSNLAGMEGHKDRTPSTGAEYVNARHVPTEMISMLKQGLRIVVNDLTAQCQAGLSLSGLLLRRAAAALHLLEEDGSADLVLLASELMRVAQQTMRLSRVGTRCTNVFFDFSEIAKLAKENEVADSPEKHKEQETKEVSAKANFAVKHMGSRVLSKLAKNRKVKAAFSYIV